MKRVLFFFGLFCAVVCAAQEKVELKYDYPEKLEYKSSIITTFDNETFKTDELKFLQNSHEISFLKNYEQCQINLQDLNAINVEKGNYAWLYGLAAVGVGLTVFQAVYSSNGWDDPFNDIDDSKITGTLIGCVVVPLAISIPIGLRHKKYKRIFDDGRFISVK